MIAAVLIILVLLAVNIGLCLYIRSLRIENQRLRIGLDNNQRRTDNKREWINYIYEKGKRDMDRTASSSDLSHQNK